MWTPSPTGRTYGLVTVLGPVSEKTGLAAAGTAARSINTSVAIGAARQRLVMGSPSDYGCGLDDPLDGRAALGADAAGHAKAHPPHPRGRTDRHRPHVP